MQSDAETVDAYLAAAPPERREVLTAIRNLCLANLPGCEETMAYGMPTYQRDKTMIAAFASQRRYISLYVDPTVLANHRAALAGASCGKSCARFTRPEAIDLGLVTTLIRESGLSDLAR
ncbi:MAG: DUF1801 domain-containing protein [Thermomicrobiales bacterium]